MGNRVTHFYFRTGLNTGDDITYVTGTDLLARTHVELENTYLVRVVFLTGVHKAHFIACVHRAVHYLEIGNDSTETIEDTIENEALQRCIRIAYRSRNMLDDRVQDLWHTFTRLC